MTGGYIPWAMALALLFLWESAGAEADQCKMTSPCFFDCGDVVMDMTALKTHLFKDVWDSKHEHKYSYSPCSTFSEGISVCIDTHACEIDGAGPLVNRNIGTTFSASLSPREGRNFFIYTHTPILGPKRTTNVTVLCGPPNMVTDPQLQVKGLDPKVSYLYEMTLTSHHACFQNKTSTTARVPTTEVTTHKHNVTTAHTTHKHNVTTAHTTHKHNVTTAHTTHKHNVTTAHTTHKHNVTTAHTTHKHNVTTVHTTPSKHNVTTEPRNITTVITTHVTGHQTTQSHKTTSPSSGADDLSRFSAERVVVALLMATVTALASF